MNGETNYMEGEVLRSVDHGGSSGLLVDESVQALASKKLKEIPDCYVRPQVELGQVSLEDNSLKIPIIDLSKLLDHQNPLSHHDELAKLHSACKDWGFFQLINHGIPKEVIENMKMDVEGFFKLPIEKKKAYSQLPGNIQGYGQAFVISKYRKHDWADLFFICPRPISQRNMRFWPTDPISFRESLEKYSLELQQVTISLLKFITKNLGLNEDTLVSMFEDGRQSVKVNCYPPCVQADKVMGITEHSDASGLTLLLEVNDVPGLQIKKNYEWIPVKSVPGAFIVNVGDDLEIMSNGEYKSIEHRGVVNPEKERLSIATFHSPHAQAVIGPLPELVKDRRANYKTLSTDDYLRLVTGDKRDGKTRVDYMKL